MQAFLLQRTNGLGILRVWSVASTNFFKMVEDDQYRFVTDLSAGAKPPIGSLVNSNFVVYATELTLPTDALSDQTKVTLTSKLVSITRAKFEEGDFEVPADYHETNLPPRPSGEVPLNSLGSKFSQPTPMRALAEKVKGGAPVVQYPKLRKP